MKTKDFKKYRLSLIDIATAGEASKETLSYIRNWEEIKYALNGNSIFKQMLADKRKIQAYIHEHGSLKGFDGEGIKFAKPL